MSIISFIHSLIILFAIVVPFLNPDSNMLFEWLMTFHVIVMPGIIMHWLMNNDMCSLTLLEAKLTNRPVEETFIASILHPFFHINNTNIYLITIMLWFTSIYKLYNSEHGFRIIKTSLQILKYTTIG
jgi:hypothetical protein